jgi:DNA-binding GntR family transcriptional regulator
MEEAMPAWLSRLKAGSPMSPTLELRRRPGAAAEAVSLVEAAYRALKLAIRENVYPPGHQAAEPEIAQQLGMSRTPVHEAIIRLQEEGLVQVLPRRGVLVCPVSPDDIREIYDVLIAVEGVAAARLAALPRAQAEAAAAQLEQATADMDRALAMDDLPAWAAADGRFHQLLTDRCGNRRLARIAGTVLDQAHRSRLLTLRLRPRPVGSSAEHRAITDAVRAGDADRAEAEARAHRTRARDALLPLLAQSGMRNL